MSVNKRIRRTPEEAKTLILDTAQERLAALGLDGLSVNGVAKAAGTSHANVIHHFGSTDGMRSALFARMTRNLLDDIRNALLEEIPPEEIISRLFQSLSQQGHGNLLAWRMLNPDMTATGAEDIFVDILANVGEEHPEQAKNVVLLIASAAMGLSICREPLKNMIGVSNQDIAQFPMWLAGLIASARAN